MKYRSPKPKPETGMEMAVTLSMPTDHDVQQSSEALIKFMAGVQQLAADTGAPWIKILCSGIPPELEERLAGAIEKPAPRLELVVNNTGGRKRDVRMI